MEYGEQSPAVGALQRRLQAAHYDLSADSVFGPTTARILAAYADATLPPGVPEPLLAPQALLWLKIAEGELGQLEVQGAGDNPRIVAYHQATSLRATHDSVPWCASFVSWALERAHLPSTRSAAARSYEQWGRRLKPHQVGPGAVVVFWRGRSKAEGKGHVGFYVGGDPKSGPIAVLGGNQSDSVCIATYKTARVQGYFWPVGVPRPDSQVVALAHSLDVGRAAAHRWA